MAPKRKRDASPKGLTAGEPLKRTPNAVASSAWDWVGSEATDISSITGEHLSTTCIPSTHRFCRNKYAKRKEKKKARAHIHGEIEEYIIVISSDEEEDPNCTKKQCKNNPNCLNYLGQRKWEDEDGARKMFLKVANLVGNNPAEEARDEDLPIGLKNLGATCYANASLQVWFRDMAFRSGVYNCQPTEESAEKFKDSPTFQLQVTFAALQESTQSVFNPTKLVESLELRTTEQQDAQEFSKLFMSHLDAEFKKQSNPVLQSLITDQFQGKQIYGTICSHCGSVSARETDFLEIEINFKNNATLEDSIAALLQEEKLSGDNQYLCSTCDGLQDATRYTELASLPPVLHFSLLRFVYDVSTMERRKSKNSINFPLTINMTDFLGNAADRKDRTSKYSEGNVYELRGVLLHKGKSAYHGHYEAQVFDDTKHSWFQFNDDLVTKIKKLGSSLNDDKHSGKPIVIDVEAEEEDSVQLSQGRSKHRENARKRRRVEDSDDDESNSPHAGPSNSIPARPTAQSESRISSKDAYMLIYARKEACPSPEIPTPPSRALEVVNALNAAHDKACDSYAKKEKQADRLFAETRRKVLDIFQSWSVGANNDKNYAIVSQQALENWIEQHAIKAAVHCLDDPSAPSEPQSVSLKDVLCSHNLYDHKKAANMKRITLEAYDRISSETNCVFSPNLTSRDICRVCVEEAFSDKLYRKEHSALVVRFDALYNVGLDLGSYWISKPWLKDWKLVNPKMHIPGQDDPPPDSSEYQSHVRCEHGGLCLNPSNRMRISIQACNLLRSLWPLWEPMTGDMEPCLVCDGLKNMGKEDRLEVRRRADDEKAKLKHMYENALNGNISLLSDVPCALVPVAFVESWRQWLSQPTEQIRPDSIDNSPFICEHEMLAIDPNCPTDIEGLLVVIQRSDWDELERLYSGGPLIAVQKSNDSQYTHEVAICTTCCQQRKTNWITTEITVRTGKRAQGSHSLASESSTRKQEPITYTSGARQSKRLRLAKEGIQKTKLIVTKSMTVKEIKVELQKELKIPTICQRLFYGGRELDDNTATVSSLQILANAIIDLQEENEVHEISDSEDVPKSKRRDEGGFGGTLLGRTEGRSSSPPKPTAPTEKVCDTCTFSNPVDLLACGMCEKEFRVDV
ncbi:cysteine proteinase [Mycena galericulata]|nr:cysteine proteinase [Mycena galericulata]